MHFHYFTHSSNPPKETFKWQSPILLASGICSLGKIRCVTLAVLFCVFLGSNNQQVERTAELREQCEIPLQPESFHFASVQAKSYRNL